jgi:AraC-like DNA-binding protein
MTTSFLSSMSQVLWRLLEARSIDPEPVFRDAGLDPAQWNEPYTRFSNEQLDRAWAQATQLTRDPCIGLDAARFISPASLHALGFAWLVSDTLYDALSRLVRYADVIGGDLNLRLEVSGESCRLTIETLELHGGSVPQRGDAFWASLLSMCRMLTSDRLAPLSLELRRLEPDCVADFYRMFQAPITFGALRDSIAFDRNTVERPLPTGNRALAYANEQVIEDYLAKINATTLGDKVRSHLIDLLPSGAFSEAAIARALHLSPRTLQRRLADEGTGFKVLLDEARRELALRFIGERRLSIKETSYLLGFSEPGNFSRAFRRWTGEAPSTYRSEPAGNGRTPIQKRTVK